MKYKLWTIVLFLCAIAFSLIAPYIEMGKDTKRYHQHLHATPKQEDTTENDFSTHLPLVIIDTNNVEIPGKSVHESNGIHYYTTTKEGLDFIEAYMDIVDHKDTYNHAKDFPTLSSKITIHVRGRSSRIFDKSNYAIRLIQEDGLNNPLNVMGMDSHHEWVLHGPFLDKTLIRNYMWYNIGAEIMGYAPNVRFCELILNGEYKGLYVMMENLTAGNGGSRIPLTVRAKHNTFSGYLLQYNGLNPSKRVQIDQFTHYARRGVNGYMEVVYPGVNKMTPQMASLICKDFSKFEKKLYSYDYDSKEFGYKSMIDIQSFVDYFLISELTCNYDAWRFSTYIARMPDDMFRIYLWDMNSCCDNFQEGKINVEGFEMMQRPWYYMMIRDEDFVNAIIKRYWELRKTYFDETYLHQYIDDTVDYLGDAIDRNFQVWGYTFDSDYQLLYPVERNIHSYDEAIQQIKDFLSDRIQWIDENIDSLKQYCAESYVKEYSEVAY